MTAAAPRQGQRSLTCTACGAPFACGPGTGEDGQCWCFTMPILETPDPTTDCLCKTCLTALTKTETP